MSLKRMTNRATQVISLLALISLLPLAAASAVYADGTWTNKAPAGAPSARFSHAMARLGEGQVLLFGGSVGNVLNNDTWVYDLSQNSWMQKFPAPAPSARVAHAMARLGEGQVLLFGGNVGIQVYSGETWVYDLSADTWMNKAPAVAPPARSGHAMAPLGEGQVLLFGGFDGSYNGETWVYDLSEESWTIKTPALAPSARNTHAMAPLGGDQVLLFGGFDGSYNGETWVYDLSEDSWTNKTPAGAPSPRYGHRMAPLGGGQVLLFGGWVGNVRNNETWVYDLSTNTWTNVSPAVALSPSARTFHAMAPLGEDQVLLFGGFVGGDDDETWFATGFYVPFRVYLPLVMRNY